MQFRLADYPPLLCPDDRQPLAMADETLLQRLNEAIAAGQCHYRDGRLIEQRLEAALVRADGRWAYRIDDDIPVLLFEEGIAVPA